MTRHASRPQRGFTVTELVVVIAIIVVLAAILFPVFANVRRNARKVQCLANLHMIGVAMGMYLRDHASYFPNWCPTHPDPGSAPTPKDAPGTGIKTWDMILGDYMEAWKQHVVCPDNPMPTGVLGPASTRETARSYALARQTQRPTGTNFFGGYQPLIVNPSETVMIFEKGANLPGAWGDALGENVNQSHNTFGQPGYTDVPFHFGGKNILFVDGNVKWFVKGTGPYAWDPAGDGSRLGACEKWGIPTEGGDWPPLK